MIELKDDSGGVEIAMPPRPFTRVAIFLIGGNAINAYFTTRAEADGFVGSWVTTQMDRIKTGEWERVDTGVYSNVRDGVATWGTFARHIIGMAVAEGDGITEAQIKALNAQAKYMAAAVEHQCDGEDWRKGSDD